MWWKNLNRRSWIQGQPTQRLTLHLTSIAKATSSRTVIALFRTTFPIRLSATTVTTHHSTRIHMLSCNRKKAKIYWWKHRKITASAICNMSIWEGQSSGCIKEAHQYWQTGRRTFTRQSSSRSFTQTTNISQMKVSRTEMTKNYTKGSKGAFRWLLNDKIWFSRLTTASKKSISTT